MAATGSDCQAIPRWLTTPLAASAASFQPSKAAMATGLASVPMSLNLMALHLPCSTAYVYQAVACVTGSGVACRTAVNYEVDTASTVR